MNLFKSQLLQEKNRNGRSLTYREKAFGPRYGSHAVSTQWLGKASSSVGDNTVIGKFAGGRDIKRNTVVYDRAA